MTTVLTVYDYRVGAGIKRNEDRRFKVIRRRDTSRFDFGLLGVLPVIVRRDQGAVALRAAPARGQPADR